MVIDYRYAEIDLTKPGVCLKACASNHQSAMCYVVLSITSLDYALFVVLLWKKNYCTAYARIC